MDKSPEAFRTISEVAEALETPAHVLRFWESRFPQIRPVKRAGGRRYYRPADVALLTGIKHLLHAEGITIRGVQKILREQGVRHVASLAGQGDIMHEDDVDALLIAAMSGQSADMDDMMDVATERAMPPLLAVESAQVVALETALARRDATRATEAKAVPETIPDAVAQEQGPPEPEERPAPVAVHAVDPTSGIAFESLAEDLRMLPRPLPAPLAARLAEQAARLEYLRGAMEARLKRRR
jgi:DNA-binding transcriptional MerR regulator